jgi:amidohydrolase
MTIVAGLAPLLRRRRLESGSVVLMFQPSEENGKGALRVLDDSRFKKLAPDYVFALHNLPGFKLGEVILRHGVFAASSIGLVIKLTGATSHAAEPEKGRTPALAVAQLIQTLSSAPQLFVGLHEAAKVTVIHARLGEIAFGTTPGYGEVMATLRTHSDAVMEQLAAKCARAATDLAQAWGLEVDVRWHEEFPVTTNDRAAVEIVNAAAESLGLGITTQPAPFPWSEDFGHFTAGYQGAIFGLGSGVDQPALHHPQYDFPEQLLTIGVDLFAEIIGRLLGWENTARG